MVAGQVVHPEPAAWAEQRLHGGPHAPPLHQGPLDVVHARRAPRARRLQVPPGVAFFPCMNIAVPCRNSSRPCMALSACACAQCALLFMLQVLLDTEGIDAYDQARGPHGKHLITWKICLSMRAASSLDSQQAACFLPQQCLEAQSLFSVPRADGGSPCTRMRADGAVQHADLQPGGAAVQPVCVQPDGRHRRGRARPPLPRHRDDQAHPRPRRRRRGCAPRESLFWLKFGRSTTLACLPALPASSDHVHAPGDLPS